MSQPKFNAFLADFDSQTSLNNASDELHKEQDVAVQVTTPAPSVATYASRDRRGENESECSSFVQLIPSNLCTPGISSPQTSETELSQAQQPAAHKSSHKHNLPYILPVKSVRKALTHQPRKLYRTLAHVSLGHSRHRKLNSKSARSDTREKRAHRSVEHVAPTAALAETDDGPLAGEAGMTSSALAPAKSASVVSARGHSPLSSNVASTVNSGSSSAHSNNCFLISSKRRELRSPQPPLASRSPPAPAVTQKSTFGAACSSRASDSRKQLASGAAAECGEPRLAAAEALASKQPLRARATESAAERVAAPAAARVKPRRSEICSQRIFLPPLQIHVDNFFVKDAELIKKNQELAAESIRLTALVENKAFDLAAPERKLQFELETLRANFTAFENKYSELQTLYFKRTQQWQLLKQLCQRQEQQIEKLRERRRARAATDAAAVPHAEAPSASNAEKTATKQTDAPSQSTRLESVLGVDLR